MISLPNRAVFLASLSHRFSSSYFYSTVNSTSRRKTKKPFLYIRLEYRSQAIDEAQKSMRSYFHQNRCLPFICAEKIAQNSPFCLSHLLRKIQFSVPIFRSHIWKTLSYEPINEFEFFFESIGIDFHDIPRFLPPKTYFFSQDATFLDAALELFRFGFPWDQLGKLYAGDASIFRNSPDELRQRLLALKERSGLDNLSVVATCLAFPYLLSARGRFLDEEDDKTFTILKRVFVESGLESGLEGNVDAWYEACLKVKFFYDLGVDKRKVEELMCEKMESFVKCPQDDLARKFCYFCKFGTGSIRVGTFLLQCPEILSLDLETPAISVLGILEHFGLEEEELRRYSKKHPYVMGRNEMGNLPNAMKALDLHEWCFEKIESSKGELLATYSIRRPDEDVDERFVEGLKKIKSSWRVVYETKKLSFLKEIGFGENDATLRTLNNLQGKAVELHEKFDFFLRNGVKHSDACYMVRRVPLLLSRTLEKLEKKTSYLLHEMGYSIDFVVNYPGFYTLDLESRLKSRHTFYLWLREEGWQDPKYSLSGMLQIPEKEFVRRLYRIHPAAPKHYLELFRRKRCTDDFQEM